MSHVYRWHPQLRASIDGPMIGKKPLHLHQSDLDSACGPYCALMALMLMKLVNRNDLDAIHKTKKVPLADFWERASRLYFMGSRLHQLVSLFKPYRHHVTCYPAEKAPVQEAVQTLRADGLCIGAIRNGDFNHWVLMVGIGQREGFKNEDSLLILDPAVPALPLLPWNATLTIQTTRRGWHRYDTADGHCKVFVDHALLLLPNIAELDLPIS